MPDYYSEKLSAERLKRVYEVAPPRTRQYLEAEVDFVLKNINPGDAVLELGCGYGRILSRLTEKAGAVFGIDSSYASLAMGRDMFGAQHFTLVGANATALPFADGSFDRVVCIQNGISAFHVDKRELITEAVRITRRGGRILFSSYSDKFWEDRLKWFQIQSDAGLLGEMDLEKTGDGVIVCKDGFTGTAIRPDEFKSLAADINLEAEIVEVDASSSFCLIDV